MTQDTREDVIEKVRKILAKADPSRNDCEAEAANALRIAKRLMAEHGLDTADIEVSGEDAEDGNFNFVNCQNETEFTGIDAEILSSFAKQYEARGWLTPKQMVLLRKKMRKYWRQVLTACDLIKLDSLIAGATFTRAAA